MKKHSIFKRIIAIAAIVAICFGTINIQAASVYIKPTYSYHAYGGNFYKVYINGKRVSTGTRMGVMYNDNVMIPYKKLLIASKKLKMTSSYSNRKLTLNYKKTKVVMYIGKRYMLVNGQRTSLNTPPVFARMYGTTLILVPAKALCLHAFDLDYEYDGSSRSIYITEPTTYTSTATKGKLQASSFKKMSTTQFIRTLGPIARNNYKQTGILASVTLAQAILESGWGKTTLAQNGNNIFGMKISLSGNNWKGSAWDGRSYCTIRTVEEYGGRKVTITAKFRKYPYVDLSIADHSAYLLNAKNGSSKRYAGLASKKTPSSQINVIVKGGYCTWSSYKSQLLDIIDRYDLTKYDVK